MTDTQMAELKWFIEMVATAIIVIQVITGIIIMRLSRQIAKNEVALAELLGRAVDQIESDLPKKK
jgi:uncharacterized membrane-anchored protein YhcB (DUF1043 family)